VIQQDRKFRRESRHILLLVDNFSGHVIQYKPTNIRIEFFAANMTSFIQPLDAGIIRCFKAHYRRSFCERAIELDEAGEDDIYKANQLEVMLMAKEAWKEVSSETIAACWRHTQIQPQCANHFHFITRTNQSLSQELHPSAEIEPLQDPKAWQIVKDFAAGRIETFPQAQQQLEAYLKSKYKAGEWDTAFKMIFLAEEDDDAAVKAIDNLSAASMLQSSTSVSAPLASVSAPPASVIAPIPDIHTISQLQQAETNLLHAVKDLHSRKRIQGTVLTLEEMLNPVEEREIGNSPYRFPGGDADIIAQVLDGERAIHEVPEVPEDEGVGLDEVEHFSIQESLDLCAKMERLSVMYSDAEGVSALEIQRHLRRMRGHLNRLWMSSLKQQQLDSYFNVTTS
jgi:hypothetical protein